MGPGCQAAGRQDIAVGGKHWVTDRSALVSSRAYAPEESDIGRRNSFSCMEGAAFAQLC